MSAISHMPQPCKMQPTIVAVVVWRFDGRQDKGSVDQSHWPLFTQPRQHWHLWSATTRERWNRISVVAMKKSKSEKKERKDLNISFASPNPHKNNNFFHPIGLYPRRKQLSSRINRSRSILPLLLLILNCCRRALN